MTAAVLRLVARAKAACRLMREGARHSALRREMRAARTHRDCLWQLRVRERRHHRPPTR